MPIDSTNLILYDSAGETMLSMEAPPLMDEDQYATIVKLMLACWLNAVVACAYDAPTRSALVDEASDPNFSWATSVDAPDSAEQIMAAAWSTITLLGHTLYVSDGAYLVLRTYNMFNTSGF